MPKRKPTDAELRKAVLAITEKFALVGREYDLGWEAGYAAGGESRDEEIYELVDNIERLRAALSQLLLNYGAALPEGQKDQRSIDVARKLLGLDDQANKNPAAGERLGRRE